MFSCEFREIFRNTFFKKNTFGQLFLNKPNQLIQLIQPKLIQSSSHLHTITSFRDVWVHQRKQTSICTLQQVNMKCRRRPNLSMVDFVETSWASNKKRQHLKNIPKVKYRDSMRTYLELQKSIVS